MVNPDVEAVGIGRRVATVANFLQTAIVEGGHVSRKETMRPREESAIPRPGHDSGDVKKGAGNGFFVRKVAVII